jgi:putative tryptophan/tyrosine transport system substrate-binding protein
MDRRTFLGTLSVGFLAAPLTAEAQQSGKVWRIGVFSDPGPAYFEAFQDGLRQLGYLPNRDIVIERRRGPDHPAAAADLVRLNVELVVTGPNTFIDIVRRATRTVPIVMVYGADPVGQGYIASLAKPGGNITGLVWDVEAAIFGKYVELLTELVPRPSSIAGIVDPTYPHMAYWTAATIAAQSRNVPLSYVEVRNLADVPRAFEAIVAQRARAVLVFGGPALWSYQARISDLARKNHLPTISMYREGPEAGGLMSYGPNLRESWRRAATYVDKILKGAKPGDLPVEQPTKFELVINLKTAKALGLTIPPSLLQRADQVIE